MIVGAVAFATPCSEAVRSSVFGVEYKERVTELHRLHMQPHLSGTGWTLKFLAAVLRDIHTRRPDLWAIVSYADTTEGHEGGIYRAASFIDVGLVGSPRKFYRDADGRLRHPRQNGVNISRGAAAAMGWSCEMRGRKRKFIKILKRCPARIRLN